METSFFQHGFVWEIYLIDFMLLNLEKNLWEEKSKDFSVDYSAIDKSDILDIHKYLMVKNNIK